MAKSPEHVRVCGQEVERVEIGAVRAAAIATYVEAVRVEEGSASPASRAWGLRACRIARSSDEWRSLYRLRSAVDAS